MASVDYSSKAMLVKLVVRQWQASKTDKRVTQKVLADNGAQDKSGRFSKRLVSRDDLAPVTTAINAIKAYHNKMTLPWDDEGRRVLPAKQFFTYKSDMAVLESNFQHAVREFTNNYEEYINKQRIVLNGLFSWDDYPGRDEIADKFGVEVTPEPVPTGNSLHVEIGEEYLREQRALIEKRVAEKMQDAHKAIYDRLSETIQHLLDSIGEGKKFKANSINNIIEICDLIPSLVIEDDDRIVKVAKEVKAAVSKFSPDTIRDNAVVSRVTQRALREQVQEIENSLYSYFSN